MTVAPVNPAVPPQNLEAEESVLGAMLIAEGAINVSVVDVHLRPEHFYRESHRAIFKAILELGKKNEGVDALTVSAELAEMGQLDEAGGKAYVHQLAAAIPSAGNARHYAELVKEQATLRQLLDVTQQIQIRVGDRRGEPKQLVEDAERMLFEIAHSEKAGDFRSIEEILHEEIDKLEALSRDGQSMTGTPSGFRDLDDITGGFQPSNLIVLAARPSMGKSALVTNIAENVAVKHGKPVALFSLEMSETELAQRFVASQARMSGDKLRKGQVARSDWPKVLKACQALEQAPLWVDDSSDIDILELRAKARRLHASEQHRGGLGMIVVDYLQLLRPDHSTDSRVEQVGQMSRGLKILARELEVPVVAVSQLSRAPEQRPDKRPLLSDLRECVTGDTLVLLADGSRKPIASLVGEQPEVLAVDESNRVVSAASDKVWEVGKRDVFEVKLASGKSVRATAKHRFQTLDGWQTVGSLMRSDHPRLQLAEDSVSWHKIESINPAGREAVYDLTVPGPSCWLADGVVTHNSGQIEQDADLVMFIYRDEYYYPEETENPGVAEILISKHRNGPIGRLELTFLERFPKFANKAREQAIQQVEETPLPAEG